MPEPVDPWWDALCRELEDILVRLDTRESPAGRLIAVHISTAVDAIVAHQRGQAPPPP